MPSEAPAGEDGPLDAAGMVDVILTVAGKRRIELVKALRGTSKLWSRADLNSGEAKALVDNAPTVLMTGVEREEAMRVKTGLEEVGAEVEVVSHIQGLIAALGDQNLEVRIKAAENLGKLGDERAVEPLVAALESVGQPAHSALFRLYSAGVPLPEAALLAMRKFGPNPYDWAP